MIKQEFNNLKMILICKNLHKYRFSAADRGMTCQKCGNRLRKKWVEIN